MIRHFLSKQFVVFMGTGGAAAIVNFTSRILYNHWVDFSTAVILAYITGMITGFTLARRFAFPESSRALHASAIYFVAVNLVAMLQTWIVSMLFAYYVLPDLGMRTAVHLTAHGIGIASTVFVTFLGHKHFTFR